MTSKTLHVDISDGFYHYFGHFSLGDPLLGWFVGGTSCTLQTLYAWLMRGFGIGMVGILIYRVLHLSLGCDSWYTRYVINLVK